MTENDLVRLLAGIIHVTQRQPPAWYHGQCDPPIPEPVPLDVALEQAKRIWAELSGMQ